MSQDQPADGQVPRAGVLLQHQPQHGVQEHGHGQVQTQDGRYEGLDDPPSFTEPF